VNDAGDQDAALIVRARRGDTKAYSALFDRHRDSVLRLTRSYTAQDDEAQDLAQEAFISAFAALDRFDAARPFRPWLLRLALNKCRDWSRRRAVRKFFAFALPIESAHEIAGEAPDPEQHAVETDTLRRTHAAIADLPDALKAPLILTAIDGHSQAEAAAILRISEKAVETRVRRARQQLTVELNFSERAEG
jgi:RNA polymerase sigma factor CnrH